MYSLYRFGPYEADCAKRELRKFGSRIRIEPKPWLLLLCLVERRGELVTREELRQKLWPQTFVDFEHGLNVAIKKLRAALCDSAESPRYIETIAGQGYRFVATVEELSGVVQHAAEAQRPAAVPELFVESLTPHLDESGQRPLWIWQANRFYALAAVVMIVLIVGAFAARHRRATQVRAREKAMLVVLPFQNLSGDVQQEYLSDGMTEELSAQLGNMSPSRLGVIGRTSAMSYKDSHATISDIGKQLGVDYVLEGSIRRSGERLRVTAQLVQVSDQAHLWSEIYDRDMRDLLRLEDEIASQLARQVGVSIALRQKPSAVHVPSPEAHDEYLLGRYEWNKRVPAGWKAGEQHFRRAIELDSQYAAPYAGLAETRISRIEANAAALRAVELDPTSAEALAALGWVELFDNWDWPAAERALKRAVELDENYAPARHTYSGLLEITGRYEEAIAQEKQALLLDPLSANTRTSLAEVLWTAGRHEEAREELRRSLDMDPKFPRAYAMAGNFFLREGKYKQAIRAFEDSVRYGGDEIFDLRGFAYGMAGDRETAMHILRRLRRLERQGKASSADLAAVELGLGHKQQALAWLEKSYQDRDDDALIGLNTDPFYSSIRAEPRFQALLERMNLPH